MRTIRPHADPTMPGIQWDTYEQLVTACEARYPGKVRLVLEVTPAAVVKIIDNERDARATITNLQRRKA